MKPFHHRKGIIPGLGSAAILAPLAVFVTFSVPAFRNIPWTFSYLAIALVAEVGGTLPALVSGLISLCGVYALVIAPRQNHFFDRNELLQVVAFVVTAGFITYLVQQRSLAMSSLQLSEAHYRSVTETASDVVITIDDESRILSINPSVKPVFGYDPEELIGQQMAILMPGRLHASPLANISRQLASGTQKVWTGIQLPGVRKDGKEIGLEISFAAHASDGRTRFTGFMRDISDRQRTEAALIQSEKLAAVGRLASSIAHEINNPLEAVTNLLYLARASHDAAQIHHYLQSADRELRRVSVIANQTLQFHRQASSSLNVKCDDLIDGSLALYQGKLTNGQLSLERRKRAQRDTNCVAGEIRQVLNNLIGNAIDATPRGGIIFTRSRDATEWKSGRTGVVVTIADTGSGISAETRSRMFEPFFSTKGAAGSGLGLWICSNLVEKNSGSLHVRSTQRPGASGTVFTLFLPDVQTSMDASVEAPVENHILDASVTRME